jgi:hypothetical protein
MKGEFDACSELAEAYPLKVFPDAIGMRPENRHNLLPYGDMVFNSFGPPNELFHAAAKRAQEIFPWVEAEALRQNLKPGGFGMILISARMPARLPRTKHINWFDPC